MQGMSIGKIDKNKVQEQRLFHYKNFGVFIY